MISHWIWAATLACLAIQAPGAAGISGTIRDVQAYPIHGATVTLVGETTRQSG